MNHNITPPDLSEICNQAHKNNTGFCRHYMFLYSLVLGMEAKNIAEFGSGFSSTCIWEALKITGGRFVSFEQRSKDQNSQWFSREMIFASEEKWNFVQGNSLQTVPSFDHNPYDIVLHDGSHSAKDVTSDINNILPHIKEDGILLLHDTNHHSLGKAMRGGLGESDIKNYKHEILTLPFGYGLTLVRILKSTNGEKVCLTWEKNK